MHQTLTAQLTGALERDDLCSSEGCGLPRHLHYDTTGAILLGCEAAAIRAKHGLYEDARSRVVEEPHNYYPAVTQAIYDTLMMDCGALISEMFGMEAHSTRLAIARRLARVAVSEYQVQEGR